MSEYRPRFGTVDQAEDQEEYRSLCGFAIPGLVCGLVSPILFLSAVWFPIPVAAVVLGWLSLHRIRKSEGALTGRTLAWIGCAVALFCMAAAPAQWYVHRRLVRIEARQFTGQVMEALRQEDIGEYYRLQRPPFSAGRGTVGSVSLADVIPNQFAREDFFSAMNDPTLKVLLNLRGRWNYVFYDTEAQVIDGDERDVVFDGYAVNWDDNGEMRTFFVDVVAIRTESLTHGKAGWHLHRVVGGVRPGAMGGPKRSL
ncbi:MAG: DUF4190 domain-containing protein [Planctomycetia bacterium]|nr:DUF4190 domain-containing protein [Planctomycetia bacterium]